MTTARDRQTDASSSAAVRASGSPLRLAELTATGRAGAPWPAAPGDREPQSEGGTARRHVSGSTTPGPQGEHEGQAPGERLGETPGRSGQLHQVRDLVQAVDEQCDAFVRAAGAWPRGAHASDASPGQDGEAVDASRSASPRCRRQRGRRPPRRGPSGSPAARRVGRHRSHRGSAGPEELRRRAECRRGRGWMSTVHGRHQGRRPPPSSGSAWSAAHLEECAPPGSSTSGSPASSRRMRSMPSAPVQRGVGSARTSTGKASTRSPLGMYGRLASSDVHRRAIGDVQQVTAGQLDPVRDPVGDHVLDGHARARRGRMSLAIRPTSSR